jgi:hypothetical protein
MLGVTGGTAITAGEHLAAVEQATGDHSGCIRDFASQHFGGELLGADAFLKIGVDAIDQFHGLCVFRLSVY